MTGSAFLGSCSKAGASKLWSQRSTILATEDVEKIPSMQSLCPSITTKLIADNNKAVIKHCEWQFTGAVRFKDAVNLPVIAERHCNRVTPSHKLVPDLQLVLSSENSSHLQTTDKVNPSNKYIFLSKIYCLSISAAVTASASVFADSWMSALSLTWCIRKSNYLITQVFNGNTDEYKSEHLCRELLWQIESLLLNEWHSIKEFSPSKNNFTHTPVTFFQTQAIPFNP